jgi:hypothetical protein
MVWDYFSQFWNSIVSVGHYSIEFFQNIGIAVAGALGSFFDVIFQSINDVFVIVVWLAVVLKTIFLALISPVSYFFNIIRWFFATAFQTPQAPEINYVFSPEILEVFDTIPYWQTLSIILGAIILMMGGVAVLKLLLKT